MKKLCLGLLLVATLTACAPQMVWNKPGATQQDFARDSYQCEKDMRQSNYFGGGIAGAINAQEFQKRCMVAAGWTLQRDQPSLTYRDDNPAALAARPAVPTVHYDVRCRLPSQPQPGFFKSIDACTAAGGTVLN